MAPLDFSGYVPGIPNMGPRYTPPSIIQLIQALQNEIKIIKKQLEGMASETDLEALSQQVDGLDDTIETLSGTVSGLSNDVGALDGRLDTAEQDIDDLGDYKEDKSNKVDEIVTPVTDTALYPNAAAVVSFVHDVDDAIRNDLEDVEDTAIAKADGGSLDGHYNFRPAVMTDGIAFGRLDSNSTSTNLHASDVPGIGDGLRDGIMVMLYNGVVTSASGCTLNVNGTGAKPIYSSMAASTRVTTAWNSAYTMLFVYDEDRDGWIMYYGIDNNTNTIGYQVRTNSYSMPMTSVTYRYRLLFTSKDGSHFVPANNSTSTNATSSRTVCQDPIDPHGSIVYYGTTAAVNQGSRPAVASLWQQYLVTLGYSFNRTGAALTLTAWDPVYVKAAPQSDGSAIIDSTEPYVQALPTTDDGFIYIFLGVAISATQIELTLNHPVYYNDGTAIRIWTGPVS